MTLNDLAVKANLIAPEYNGFDRTALTPAEKKFTQLVAREVFDWVVTNVGLMEDKEWQQMCADLGIQNETTQAKAI